MPFVAIQINNRDRLVRRLAQVPRDQKRCEMIARWHVPFACADEDSRLLGWIHTKIPSLILDWIRGWDKSHRHMVGFRPDALINFLGLGGRGDASVGLAYNFHEAR